MRTQRHLVIFAKAPCMGRVKTRLAKSIGTIEAWSFYRHNLRRISKRLGDDKRWNTYLCVSPDTALPRMSSAYGLRTIEQGSGDLGQRMQRIMDTMPTGPVLIIGTDIPDISPSHIHKAFTSLGNHHAVFGPALDGGYWLTGLKRSPRIPKIYNDVRWSSEHALQDTRQNLINQSMSIAQLDELEDVDDLASWQRWRGSRLL